MPKSKKQVVEEARGAIAAVLEQAAVELEEPRKLRPGEVNPKTKQKTPWTMRDLEEAYGICEFTPDETIPVTVSGVQLWLLDGVTMTAPCCFRDVWQNSRAARKGKTTAKSLRRMGIVKEDYPGSI